LEGDLTGGLTMPIRQRRYPKEEFARRGNEIYERDVLPQTTPEDKGKYVAIDIETGAWEMDESEIVASDHLRARIPDAQTWMTRVGYGYIRRFGAGRVREAA
jgi:hypothetical protein